MKNLYFLFQVIFSFLFFTNYSTAQIHNFSIFIDGFQANAGAGTGSNGTGFGWATYDEGSMQLTVKGDFAGMTGNTTVAHVHVGAAGSNGGVQVPLTLNLAGSTSGDFFGTGILTSTQETNLLSDGMYVNIHSSFAPSGEIRGQIIIYTHCFDIMLDGAQANAGAGTGSAGTGTGKATYNQNTMVITSAGNFSNLTGISTVAHIHQAPAGANGGVKVPYTLNPSGATSGDFRGSDVLIASEETALLADGMYANIHSSMFAAGEIRGQLLLSSDLDMDGVFDCADNCINIPNPTQTNIDGDNFGAECDCDDTNPNDPISLTINDIPIAPDFYTAEDEILSQGTIYGGDTVVTFRAGNSIFLLEGFIASAGPTSDFLAYVDPCGISTSTFQSPPNTQLNFSEASNPTTNEVLNQSSKSSNSELNIFPNPFNTNTNLVFYLEKNEKVSLSIYDATGRLQQQLINEHLLEGEHRISLDASNYPKGIYLAKLRIGNKNISKRMIVL